MGLSKSKLLAAGCKEGETLEQCMAERNREFESKTSEVERLKELAASDFVKHQARREIIKEMMSNAFLDCSVNDGGDDPQKLKLCYENYKFAQSTRGLDACPKMESGTLGRVCATADSCVKLTVGTTKVNGRDQESAEMRMLDNCECIEPCPNKDMASMLQLLKNSGPAP